MLFYMILCYPKTLPFFFYLYRLFHTYGILLCAEIFYPEDDVTKKEYIGLGVWIKEIQRVDISNIRTELSWDKLR